MLVSLVVLTAAAVAGIAWYFSGVAIAVGSHRLDPVATVVSLPTGTSTIELTRGPETLRPGTEGLEWDGGYGQLGKITKTTATTVTREFTAITGRLVPGAPVALDVYAYPGDPQTALGLAFQDLPLQSDAGSVPAWYVPGDKMSGTWVVFVHGHDGSRREALRYLTLLHGEGLPVLVPTYRNDEGAAASPDGKDHLGGTEWRDVEPSVQWALDHGARDVVLFGWSMGGAVSLQFADRSALRTHVRALVLDSPVIDWASVLSYQAGLRGLPAPVTAAAEALVGLRLGTSLDRFDWVARSRELRVPVLVFHSAADDYVPYGPTQALARARPDLVTFDDIPGAGHTRGWNVAPDRYAADLRSWLTRQGIL